MKCEICKKKLDETFLNKFKGTYVKGKKGLYSICIDCQKSFHNSKGELLKQIER